MMMGIYIARTPVELFDCISSNMRSIAALLLLVAVSYVSTQDTPVILCGRQLANARVMLCYGSEYVDKRGSLSHYTLNNLAEGSIEDLEWPWSGRRGALSASWPRYKRHGLADECCLKPCKTEVILDYC